MRGLERTDRNKRERTGKIATFNSPRVAPELRFANEYGAWSPVWNIRDKHSPTPLRPPIHVYAPLACSHPHHFKHNLQMS